MIKKDIKKRSIIVLLSLSVINFYHRFFGGYGRPLDPFRNIERKIEIHNAIIAGASTRIGNNYRVFAPYVNELFINIFDVFLPYKYSFALSYAIFEFFAIFVFITVFFCYIRIWYSPTNSLLGTTIMSISLTTTMTFSFSFHPWSFAEGAIFILGLYVIYYEYFYFIILFSVLGVINRPTGAIIPLIYVIKKINYSQIMEIKIKNSIDDMEKILFLFIFSIIPFVYLQFFRTVNNYNIQFIIQNLAGRYMPVYGQDWLASLLALFSFLGFMWFFVIIGFLNLPKFIKSSSIGLLIFYFPLILLTGDPTELRLLIPLYPVFIPAILNVIISDSLFPIQYSERGIRNISIVMTFLSLFIFLLSMIMSPEILLAIISPEISAVFSQDGAPAYQTAISKINQSKSEINLFRLVWGLISAAILLISVLVYSLRDRLVEM